MRCIGLTQLTTEEIRASPVGAYLPVGPTGVATSPVLLSVRPTHPFGHGLSASLAVSALRDVQPFTSVQPSGPSLGRTHLEAGRLWPLSQELRTPPLPETHVLVGTPGHHKAYSVLVTFVVLHQRSFFGPRYVRIVPILVAPPASRRQLCRAHQVQIRLSPPLKSQTLPETAFAFCRALSITPTRNCLLILQLIGRPPIQVVEVYITADDWLLVPTDQVITHDAVMPTQ